MRRATVLVMTAALAAVIMSAPVGADDALPLEEHYKAALAALARGDDRKARRELQLSLQDQPLHGQSHFVLASLLAREGALDQAIVGFQRATALQPNNAAARYNLGTALLWRGEPVSAARQLEAAIAIRPDHVPSYNNLAKAYFLVGLPELAVAMYQEALRRDPLNAVALQNLAVLNGAPGDQEAPGEGGARKLVVRTVKTTRTPGPPAAAAGGQGPQADAPPTDSAGPPVASDAGREPSDDPKAEALREIVRDLPHVKVEVRGGRLVLSGWTSGPEARRQLDKILMSQTDVLDLTTEDTGDPHRLVEVEATILRVAGLHSQDVGQNFLRSIALDASVFDEAYEDAVQASLGWLWSAAIEYRVSIANAAHSQIQFLGRPRLTALSGTPAKFISGGDIVYRVSGTTSGDIKPYPFGTTLEVTPTLLRTRAEDGTPLVKLLVTAGRKSILPQTSPESLAAGLGTTAFENIEVTSTAVLALDQTLILTGLSQRELRTGNSGVPLLKSIPIVKYLFSEKNSLLGDLSIIILLTPRDPAFFDEQDRKSMAEFIEKRRAHIQAAKGTEVDMRRFKERYPDWGKLPLTRFASPSFLMENKRYGAVSGVELAHEPLDLDVLSKLPRQPARR